MRKKVPTDLAVTSGSCASIPKRRLTESGLDEPPWLVGLSCQSSLAIPSTMSDAKYGYWPYSVDGPMKLSKGLTTILEGRPRRPASETILVTVFLTELWFGS